MRAVFAIPGACSQKFERGTIRRMFSAGPLLGYMIACPGCRFTGSHLHDDVRFTEGPVELATAIVSGTEIRWYHPSSVSAEKPMRCYGCARFFTLREGDLALSP